MVKNLMKKLTTLCATTLCATALLTSTACDITKPKEPEKKNEEIEVFRIGVTESENLTFNDITWEYFHPHYSNIIPFLIFDSITDIINLENSPEAFRISSDGRECIITLPNGILFHDGTELFSDDMLYSIDSLRHAQANLKVNGNPFPPEITTEKLTDRKIAIRSKFPQKFKYELHFTPIISNSNNKLLDLKEKSIYFPNGTGPYKFSNIDIENKIISLERFNKYRLSQPFIKKIELVYFKDLETAAMALMEGKVDYAPYFGNIEKETIGTSRKHTLFRYPMHYCNVLILNTASPKFHDARVRRALSLLIDRQSVAETHRGLPGTRVPTSTFMNFSFPKTEPSVDAIDGKEAMRLLREAGYNLVDGKLIRNGKQLSIKIDIGNIQGVAYLVEAARMIAKYWENAGISCNITSTGVIKLKRSGDFDAIFFGVLETTAEKVMRYLLNSSERGGAFHLGFMDNKLDRLREEFKNEFRDDILLEKKLAMQARLKELCPVIPLYYDYGFAGLGAKFKDNEKLKKVLSGDPGGLSHLAEYR